jgi:hypothetical protein
MAAVAAILNERNERRHWSVSYIIHYKSLNIVNRANNVRIDDELSIQYLKKSCNLICAVAFYRNWWPTSGEAQGNNVDVKLVKFYKLALQS